MTTTDPVIAGLWAQAAFVSGWPTLRWHCPDEATVQHRLTVLVGRLGPLPQADVIEPYSGEDWELRVTMPELEPEQWVQLSAGSDFDGLELVPGYPTGARFALDCLVLDVEEGPGLARRSFRGDDEYRRVLLRGREPDAESRALEQELVDAYRRVNPALYMESDRGMDTAELVVEPCSGRFGLRLCFPHAALAIFEDMAGAREALFQRIESVIRSRASNERVRLWPRIDWSSAAGIEICLWMIAAHRPVFPGELPQAAGRTFPLQLGRAERVLELRIVPATLAEHIPLAIAAAELIDASGFALSGGWPRWVLGRDGNHRFGLTWRFSPNDIEHGRAVLTWAERRRDVYECRLLPGPAHELDADWQQLDPIWYAGNQRAFVVSRDYCTGRDRAVPLRPRVPDGRDERLLRGSYPACVQGVQPVQTTANRPAWLWRFGPDAWSIDALLPFMAQLDQVAPNDLGPVIDLGFDRDGGFALGWRLRASGPQST